MIDRKIVLDVKLWLFLIGLGIVALNLITLSNASKPELLNTSILLWIAVGSIIWEKRNFLNFQSDLFSTCLGATLITFVLLRSVSYAGYNFRFSPLASFLGLILLTSGTKSFCQFKKEILILSLPILSAFVEIALNLFNLSLITAKFSGFVLWYLGFEVVREGLFLILPTGIVEVYHACSGASLILMMLTVSVLFLIFFPISSIQKFFCVLGAILVGFVVNSARVALMAILVAYSNIEAFEYWHGGDGALVFSLIAVLIFSFYCWLAFLRQVPNKSDANIC